MTTAPERMVIASRESALALWQARHILERVHREVGASVEQGLLQLFHEQPLATDLL